MKPTVFLLLSAASALALRAQAIALADPAKLKLEYDRLMPSIEKIPIFDDHAHPGFADDPDVDAMAAPPGSEALRTRATNPELIPAAKALFGFPYEDMSPDHMQWLAAKKKSLRGSGTAYFNDILDKIGISESVANRVAMAPYLDPRRFRWVAFADSFLFPFDNTAMIARNPDQQVYIPLQEKKLKRELTAASMTALPSTLDDYVAFVTRTLNEDKRLGAIAIKFEAAYFRSLHFADPSHDAAATVYSRFHLGGQPSLADYTLFQDYVFRRIVVECGRLHLAVHFHSAVGIGDYFNLANGNVMNLENVLRDPRYSATTFVLIHGGYPHEREAIWLAARKNVYLDSSFIELVLYPSAFSRILKQWLEIFPDKIVFGSDCFPYNDALGSEESYWLAVNSARSALAAALAEMVVTREITEPQALQMARSYLHDTAAALYPR